MLLHFGAVDYRAEVWVNGQHVAAHEGGHTPFSADITAALRTGDEQVIVVRAEDHPHDLAQPRGKQDWQPEPHAHLVSPHHRHLAAGLAGAGAADPHRRPALDAGPRAGDRSA